MDEPKPKRKRVMTPEGLAKIMANLAQARLVPKEVRYRKTEKRYNANINNLGKANAKRREQALQEEDELHAKMETVFPPPVEEEGTRDSGLGTREKEGRKHDAEGSQAATATDNRPRATDGSSANPEPRNPKPASSAKPEPRVPSPGSSHAPAAEMLEKATRLVRKRLRRVRGQTRREGRRIMRVLTEALEGSHPLSFGDVVVVALDLLRCLNTWSMTERTERLNRRIRRLLVKMIEKRYGPEPPSEPEEWEIRGRELLEKLRQENAGSGTRGVGIDDCRPPNDDSRSGQARPDDRSMDPAGGVQAQGTAEAQGAAQCSAASPRNRQSTIDNRQSKTPAPHILPLPKTEEDFRKLLVRALDLEWAPDVAKGLAGALWARLHFWQQRQESEARELGEFFQDAADRPPLSYPKDYQELRDRAEILPAILDLELGFLRRMDERTERVKVELKRWQEMVFAMTKESEAKSDAPPCKPPVDGTSEGSGKSEVA